MFKGHQGPYTIERSFLLILKWGGELTKKGMAQAEELGRYFRLRYPGDHGKLLSTKLTNS